jgi:murein L,D-transpeptidase YcbB/YkuD
MVIMLLVLAGCATTQGSRSSKHLEMKVSELERQLEYKDDEIRSLKYEVEDLSKQLSKQQPLPGKTSSTTTSKTDIPGYKETGIIRMPVTTEQVQQALQNAGVYSGPIDGKVGNQTRQAIADFQKQNSLPADGIVGVKTWAALEKYLE